VSSFEDTQANGRPAGDYEDRTPTRNTSTTTNKATTDFQGSAGAVVERALENGYLP
jgi:hypothetical protein